MSARSNGRHGVWTPRALDIVSAGCVLVAIVFLLLPASPTSDSDGVRPVSLREAATVAAHSAVMIDSAREAIVRTNVFSATRRAPSVRFVAPGAMSPYEGPIAVPDVMTAPALLRDDASASDDVPHLYGVVYTDGEPRALLALAAGESPRLLSVGERHAGYRVTTIESDRVVLANASGVRTLRLARRAPRDTSENLP